MQFPEQGIAQTFGDQEDGIGPAARASTTW